MTSLQENQRMHRELTAKTAKLADSDDENSEADAAQVRMMQINTSTLESTASARLQF